MLYQFFNGLVWLSILSSWQINAMDNPRQPIIDLGNQIEELTLDQGPFSIKLIEPVMTLAKLYLEADELESATDQLRRAQNIAHRNEGVYTPRQFEVITLLTQIALSEENYRAADTQQKFAFFVQSHHLDPQSPEILSTYSEMANWYMFTGQTRRARRLLEEGVEKATSLELDPLLLAIELSKARRLEGTCCPSKELLALVEKSSNSDRDTLAKAYLELADAFILARKEKIAIEYFVKAREVSPRSLNVDPRPILARSVITDPQAQRAEIYHLKKDRFNQRRLNRSTYEEIIEDAYAKPQWFILDGDRVHKGFIVPDRNANSSQDRKIKELVGSPILFSIDQLNNVIPLRLKKRMEELKIELSFTVTSGGDLKEIEVKKSTAPVKLNRLVVDSLKKAYYRPGLVNGLPITTKNVPFVQTFSLH